MTPRQMVAALVAIIAILFAVVPGPSWVALVLISILAALIAVWR